MWALNSGSVRRPEASMDSRIDSMSNSKWVRWYSATVGVRAYGVIFHVFGQRSS
jgi:hypothetical protein